MRRWSVLLLLVTGWWSASGLDIEEARFADRLQVTWDISPLALTAAVPPLILRPLVENAIKHGLWPRPSAGHLHLHAAVENGQLVLSVPSHPRRADLSTYRRLSRYSLAIATASVLALATFQAPAHAAAIHYVALGDSYASGVGTGTYYNDGSGCYRSPQSYAPLWATAHTAASFTFAACGGAVTSGVINNQLGALNTSTTHVTVSIGGNDAGFINVVLNCRLGTDSSCNNAVVQAENFA